MKKILVVDDDKDINELIELVLATRDYEVECQTNPEEAISHAEKFSPDAILLDLSMPDVDGWEIFKQLREHKGLKSVPVAILTARSGEFDTMLGLHVMKADAYIKKPFGKKELLTQVEGLFEE